MTVTITQAEVTVAIRAATTTENVDPTVAAVIAYLYAAAGELVVNYAPDAPDDIHNAAMIRLTGWLYDSDPTEPGIGRAIQTSGAAALLGPWRSHRAGIIGGGVAPVTPAGGAIPDPPTVGGSFVLLSINGAFQWISFPNPS